MKMFYRVQVAVDMTTTGVVEVEAGSVAEATSIVMSDFDGVCKNHFTGDSVKTGITNRRIIRIELAPIVETEEGD